MAKIHESNTSFTNKPMPKDRSFGLLFGAIFAIFAAVAWRKHWLLFGFPAWPVCAVTAFIFGTLAWLLPTLLHPLNALWFKLAMLMSKLIEPIVMSVVFLGVLTPLAVLKRLFSKPSLALSYDTSASSYWIKRDPPGPDSKNFHEQF